MRPDELHRIEERGLALEDLVEMEADEIGHILRHPRLGEKVCGWATLGFGAW